MFTDEQIEAVAKAIEGPWNFNGASTPDLLARLREIRWNRLSDQEKGVRLCEARAALIEAQELREKPVAVYTGEGAGDPDYLFKILRFVKVDP